jgi:DNA-binding response OmpR family regulator
MTRRLAFRLLRVSAVMQSRLTAPRILVAEDDPAMRRWLVMVLAAIGGRIHAVADGWQVWSVLMEEEIDLVISDVRMPQQDGLEALTVVRVAGLKVPFLLITAFGGDDVRSSAQSLGAEVLDKPFAASELLTRVRRLCGLPEP